MDITTRLLLICLFVLMVLPSCNRSRDPEERRLSWSTESPMSIPYRVRQQRFEKGNLLRNPSFETGKTLQVDSTQQSAVIEGWHQVGPHVDWVDINDDSLFMHDEAFSGRRSIRIIRTRADETEKLGEGILSEYIKVIPGNYSLSFYARMNDVKPVTGRLGMRMVDAINIRLQYFDKNKIALDPAKDYPQQHKKIDNSFKALSLANFTTIPEFAWGKIIGKTAGFPFPDGDIPTDAHYVKIFIGLKGTGTLWIDSVNFSYTRQNFSVGERMSDYTDTTMGNQLAVIPGPKRMLRLESVAYSTAGKPEEIPVILIPEDADPIIRQSAIILQNALTSHSKAESRAVPVVTGEHAASVRSKLTFVLGDIRYYAAYNEQLSLNEIQSHSQGYIIQTLSGLPGVVFLKANNPVGIYYAVMTAIQLIDPKMPVFHNARVVDYPDFENRFVTLSGLTEDDGDLTGTIGELSALKLNGAFSRIPSEGITSNRHFTVRFLPVWPEEPIDSTLGYIWPVQSGLAAIEVQGAPNGPSPLPGFVIPALFHNQLLDYVMAGQADEESNGLPRLYAGSNWFSMHTDAADFERYTKNLSARPFFMDNSMQANTSKGQYGGTLPWYPGKLRLYNLFEPFGNVGIRTYFDRIDNDLYWTNLGAGSEINLIRLATAADFMWNSAGYSPDLSLWRVLMSRYGAESARMLVDFADQYGLLLEIGQKLRTKEPLPRSLKNIQADIDKLNTLYAKLEEQMGPDQPLLRELLTLENAVKEDLQPFFQSLP